MRMQPGALTIEHDHPGMEEFLVLGGDLVDSDATVFTTGDFVSYQAGTHHNSWTENGCLLADFERRKRRNAVWRDEKGGDVRRPFSRNPVRGVIAVSSQPESSSLSAPHRKA